MRAKLDFLAGVIRTWLGVESLYRIEFNRVARAKTVHSIVYVGDLYYFAGKLTSGVLPYRSARRR